MKDKILERITISLDDADIVDKLAVMPAKDFQSLLLYVFERRVQPWTLIDLTKQYSENRFVEPCNISQRDLVFFDYQAFRVLSLEYEGIELSPLAPFGTNSVLAGTDQKNVMTTVRNIEIIADPSTALALECASRRSELIALGLEADNDIKLATSQRNVRLQNFKKIPGFQSHFRIFALASAGQGDRFEQIVMGEHMAFYLVLLQTLGENGYHMEDITLFVSDIRIAEKVIRQFCLDRNEIGKETQNPNYCIFEKTGVQLPPFLANLEDISQSDCRLYKIGRSMAVLSSLEKNIVLGLRERFPGVRILFDLHRIAGIGYYPNLCFKIVATNKDGDTFPLVDGGFTDWTQKLLQSKKEKLLVSGIGTDLFCQQFKN